MAPSLLTTMSLGLFSSLPPEVCCQYRNRAVALRPRDTAGGVFAGNDPAFAVVGIAVCHIAGLPPGFNAAVRPPAPHDFAGNVAEDEVVFKVVPDRAFGEFEAAGDFFDIDVIADDCAESLVADFYVHWVLRVSGFTYIYLPAYLSANGMLAGLFLAGSASPVGYPCHMARIQFSMGLPKSLVTAVARHISDCRPHCRFARGPSKFNRNTAGLVEEGVNLRAKSI